MGNLTVLIEDNLHKKIKSYCLENDILIKEFLTDAIKLKIKKMKSMEEK